MKAPAVQFTTTADGVRIACTELGSGLPFVFLPLPFNNLGRVWRQETRSLYEPLAGRFRLIQYDCRGLGLSSRGLSPRHSYDDYLLDLEAIIEHFALDRFVMYGGLLSGHIAVKYAVEHPEQVEALVLQGISADAVLGGVTQLEDAAARDWEAFLGLLADVNRSPGGDPKTDYGSRESYRETVTQADLLTMIRSARGSNVEALLPRLASPVLVVSQRDSDRERVPISPARIESLAAAIPNARLVTLPGRKAAFVSWDGSESPLIAIIDDFMAAIGRPVLPSSRPTDPVPAGLLTDREAEVLRLVAGGRSNQEIADELVVSVRTIERHVNHVYDKLGVHNRAQATAYAVTHGLT